jgi:hypothetical protein
MATQEDVTMEMMLRALQLLKATIAFKSVHAAALQPARLARWLGCYPLGSNRKVLPEEHYACLAQLAAELVRPELPATEESTPEEAPGRVAPEQWREGALQLQQEVGDCLCDQYFEFECGCVACPGILWLSFSSNFDRQSLYCEPQAWSRGHGAWGSSTCD